MSIAKVKNSVALLRISIGFIYLWFGVLKFFAGVSPAEVLAKDTIALLTFNLIPGQVSILLLAVWEVIIGVLLMAGLFIRPIFWLVIIHMICTFMPLVLLPDVSFTGPGALTLVGQYIIKNVVVISALWVVRVTNEKTETKF